MLSWRVSNTMDADFCIEALEEALAWHGRPEIFNTDQGSQGGFKWSSQLYWLTGGHGKPTPHLLTVSTRFGVVAFDGVGSSTLDKHSAVLGLVQDEPTLRADAASGILDKTCARRSAGGRSAPRNGPLCLTKECNLDLLDLGSGWATSEATPNTVSSGCRLTWPISAIGQAPLPAFAK